MTLGKLIRPLNFSFFISKIRMVIVLDQSGLLQVQA